MKKGKVVIVANQKGGVGKSTTSFILQDELSKKRGAKVLLIDYDPQGTLTKLLDIDESTIGSINECGSICNIFERKEVTILEYHDNLDVVISDKNLNGSFYSSRIGKEMMLNKFLETVKYDYDLVLIDTKPDIDIPLVSAVLAADIIINTIATGGIEEDSTLKFYDKLEEVMDLYDKKIEKVYVIPTLLDSSRDSKGSLLSIKNNIPILFENYSLLSKTSLEILKAIPRRAAIKNATGAKVGVRQYIEEFDTKKKDILLDIEKISKAIWKGAKQ